MIGEKVMPRALNHHADHLGGTPYLTLPVEDWLANVPSHLCSEEVRFGLEGLCELLEKASQWLKASGNLCRLWLGEVVDTPCRTFVHKA
jgi:hypothetical protein